MELKLDKLTDDKTIIGNILIGLKRKIDIAYVE